VTPHFGETEIGTGDRGSGRMERLSDPGTPTVATVLVTGSAGFIGTHCIAALVDHERALGRAAVVRTAARRPSGTAGHEVVDLLEPGAPRALVERVRPTHLLHLAWTTGEGYGTDPANDAWRRATLELLDAFGRADGRRAVLVGSCAEYAWDTGPCSEAITPLRPASPYGVAKAATWESARVIADAHRISVAWARPFWLYGPGERAGRLVPDACRALLRGERFHCSGTQRRDFVHVRDVAAALVSLLAADADGAFDIASGVPVGVAEVVRTLAELVGRPDLVTLVADLPGTVAEVVGAPGRLTTELGWAPLVGIREGLAEVIDLSRRVTPGRTPRRTP
jgi:nucleoside-diphosphate-sugar epimerase